MLREAVITGTRKGLSYCIALMKIIVPVYIAIIIARHTPFMGWLAGVFGPVMGIFHLPGEGAVPLITGFFLDEYAVIAAIKAVGLTGFDVTIVAMMSIIAHSLFIESAIIKKLGLSMAFFTGYRLFFAVVLGILFGWAGEVFLHG